LMALPAWALLDSDRHLVATVRASDEEEARRIFRQADLSGRWLRQLTPPAGAVSPVRLERLAALLTDPDVLAGKHLPQEEQEEYRRCQQSIIDARRHAEPHAHEHVVWR
jgi:hypothetical protein